MKLLLNMLSMILFFLFGWIWGGLIIIIGMLVILICWIFRLWVLISLVLLLVNLVVKVF